MKIAQIAPLYEAVPPRLYGGTERVVANLTNALVDLGHDVTLFASAETNTRARLVPVRDQAIRLDPAPLKSELAAHMTLLSEVLDQAHRFDILHFHTELLHFPFFGRIADKTVTTPHGRLDLKDLEAAYTRWHQFGLVSISNNQRKPMPHANWLATVPHGIAEETYRASTQTEGYLAFLGRISPEKRPDRAIAIATALGKPLKIAAKVDDADRTYWQTIIRPLVENNPLIEFVGEIGDAEKSDFLGGAEALLFPIDWPEPFGLVMIEAMACGTPVVAFRCGSTPEIIDHGLTGYLVDDINQAIEATRHAPRLDRSAIRRRFEEAYSSTAMARGYLDVYASVLAKRPFSERNEFLSPGDPMIWPEPRAFVGF